MPAFLSIMNLLGDEIIDENDDAKTKPKTPLVRQGVNNMITISKEKPGL